MDIDYDGIEEIIEQFTFRNQGALKIPKRIREVAFTLQIDVEVQSVSTSQYINFKSTPPNGFYGYATIVRRDFTDLIIPLEQGRQCVFYERQDMAHDSWYQLYLGLFNRKLFVKLFTDTLDKIGLAAGVDLNEVTLACPSKPVWQEIPVSELYIKAESGTQFIVEVSYWKAKPIEIEGCGYDGKSGVIDGDKDNGLPNKTLPREAPDKNNPFGGLPPASTNSELGDLLNEKQNGLSDRKNLIDVGELLNQPATEETDGYYWEINWNTQTAGANICTPIFARLFKSAPPTTAFRQTADNPANNQICLDARSILCKLVNSGTETTFFDRGGSFVTSGNVNAFINYGKLPVPDGTFIFE